MEISSSHLRYLYAIYEISQTEPDVCSASVADRMQVSKPSVARMLGILMKKQLIVKELYGKIYLTDKGFLLARDFDCKVRLLAERIPRMGLEFTEKETHAAACAMATKFLDKNRMRVGITQSKSCIPFFGKSGQQRQVLQLFCASQCARLLS